MKDLITLKTELRSTTTKHCCFLLIFHKFLNIYHLKQTCTGLCSNLFSVQTKISTAKIEKLSQLQIAKEE